LFNRSGTEAATKSDDRMIDLRSVEGGVRIKIRVQPRARRNAIESVIGDALKVRVTAPPVEGQANAALVALLAETFGVARSAVSIVAGEGSRDKIVAISGVSVAQARHVLAL
jgi:uncharacterized protein (TIGR00251 family)